MIPSSFSPVVPDMDPRPVLDMNCAFARTAMLVAAVHLHIFTLLSGREQFFAPYMRDLFPLVYPIATRMVRVLGIAEHGAILVLDVGVGSATFTQQYPKALVTAIDLPAVVAEGRQQIAELGLDDRYTWVEVDIMMVSLLPDVDDLVILAPVCWFIGEQQSRELLKKLYRCLRCRELSRQWGSGRRFSGKIY
jgi:hypothetical protein